LVDKIAAIFLIDTTLSSVPNWIWGFA